MAGNRRRRTRVGMGSDGISRPPARLRQPRRSHRRHPGLQPRGEADRLRPAWRGRCSVPARRKAGPRRHPSADPIRASRVCDRSLPQLDELCADERKDVVWVRVAAEHLLLEHELVVDVHVEDAARAGNELDRPDPLLLPLLEQSRGQTGGVRARPSGDAVLDTDVVARHRAHCVRHHRGHCRSASPAGPG